MINTLNQIADGWFSWQVSVLWQVAVLIAIVFVIDLIIKKWAWPQVRYALWLLVVVKLILPPTLTSPASITSEIPAIAENAVNIEFQKPEVEERPITALLTEQPVLLPETLPNHEPSYEITAIEAEPIESITLSWKTWLLITWLGGILVLSSWLYLRLRSLRLENTNQKVAKKLPERFDEIFNNAADRLHLSKHKRPKVVLSKKVKCPAVFGVFNPVLLMPADKFSSLKRSDLENILLHELAHIKRGDLWVHGVFMCLQIAYWFNPLLWLIRRPLQNLRELCCDATVAKLLREKTYCYRETLLETARQLLAEPTDPGLGLLGLFENSNWLVDRLSWLEKKTWKNRKIRFITISALVMLMFVCVIPMAAKENLATKFTESTEIINQKSEVNSQKSEYKTTLANGVTVELVGICEHPSPDSQWFRPDGEILEQKPYEKLKARHVDTDDLIVYELLYRIDGSKNTRTKILLNEFVKSTSGADKLYKAARGIKLKEPEKYYRSIVSFDKQAKIADIDFVIGDDSKWITDTALNGDNIANSSTNGPNAMINTPIEKDGRTYVNIAHNAIDKEFRVVAVDKNNKIHHGASDATFSNQKGMGSIQAEFNLPLEKIKSIEFQTQKFQRITFKNISLRPDLKTKVQIDVELPKAKPLAHNKVFQDDFIVADNYIADLPKAGRVELVSVCRFVKEGKETKKLCWNPDGSIPERHIYADDYIPKDEQESVGFVFRSSKRFDRNLLSVEGQPERARWSGRNNAFDENGRYLREGNYFTYSGLIKDRNSTSIKLRIQPYRWVAKGKYDGKYTTESTDKRIRFIEAYDSVEGAKVVFKAYLDGVESRVTVEYIELNNANLRRTRWDSSSISTVRNAEGEILQCATFRKLKIKDIKFFRLETRPKKYEFVEYKNVSLEPNFKTDVQVKTEKATEDTEIEKENSKLTDQVKQEIAIVTKEAFLEAIIKGDFGVVQELLVNAPNLISTIDKGKGHSGLPALDLAIKHGHSEIVELLLSKGANPNGRNVYGHGPLHIATKNGHANLIKILVDYGADINGKKNGFRYPPLCYATNKQVTEALIANGADVNWRDEGGATPLHSIARCGVTAAAEVVLAHGADINIKDNSGRTPLHMAASRCQREMVEFLITKGTNINAKDRRNNNPIACAMMAEFCSKSNKMATVELLISNGTDFTIYDVAWIGDMTRVRKLLESNPYLANETAYREPVLFAAIREGHNALAEFLLDKGAKLNIKGRYKEPPLHAAAYSGHKDIAALLLRKGANVNQKGANGELALHWAVAKAHGEVVQLLVETGAEVNSHTDAPRADVDVLPYGDDADVIREQLRFLADREKQKQAIAGGNSLQIGGLLRLVFAAKDTPLHSAAQWGHKNIAELLLANGANVNSMNRFGQTPLHYAVVFKHEEIVRTLLNAGANPGIKTLGGFTAHDFASKVKDEEIADILKKEQIEQINVKKDAIKPKPVEPDFKKVGDLSFLTENLSLEDAIGEFRNITDPPLTIVVLWRDLYDNAGITPDTPIGIGPLSNVSLKTALKLLLNAIDQGLDKPDYIVMDGAIVIGTKQTLSKLNMSTKVYDVSDLTQLPADYYSRPNRNTQSR